MIVKRDGRRPSTASVTFVLPDTIWADSVHLVGDFNNWNCHSHPLVRVNGRWQVTIELPQGGLYQFRYLLDGAHWCNDWNADQYAANPLGGDNSVLSLAGRSSSPEGQGSDSLAGRARVRVPEYV